MHSGEEGSLMEASQLRSFGSVRLLQDKSDCEIFPGRSELSTRWCRMVVKCFPTWTQHSLSKSPALAAPSIMSCTRYSGITLLHCCCGWCLSLSSLLRSRHRFISTRPCGGCESDGPARSRQGLGSLLSESVFSIISNVWK